MAENQKFSLMSKLILNPATKKALKTAPDKAEFLKTYLFKNYTVETMTDIIASYYLDETSNVPKIKITEKQIKEFFVISEKD